MSRIATRLYAAFWRGGKPFSVAVGIGFAGEIISCRQLALLVCVETSLAKDQPPLFEDRQMTIDARAGELASVDEIGLRREAALRRVVAIGKAPKQNFRRRVEPALLDRPDGREVAHGAAAMILRERKAAYRWVKRWVLPDALRQGRSARPCNAMILFSKPLVGREGLEPPTRPL